MRIRTALFGSYAAVSAVGLAGLMVVMLAAVRPRYIGSVERNLHETARLLAGVLGARAASGGRALPSGPAAPGELAALVPARGTLHIRITDAGGLPVLDTDPSQAAGPGDLSASEPISGARGPLGRVWVSQPAPSVNGFIRAERLKLLAVASLVGLAAAAAGWWVSARLTHSIERLTDYANAVRDGRPGRPPASRADEIAALGRAFEGMRETIEGKAYVEGYTRTLTHEIKAPLSAIRGAVELLGEDLPAADRDRFLANLRSEAARIQDLVDRMLELASIEARHGRLERAPAGMRDIATEAIARAHGTASSRSVTLRLLDGGEGVVQGERFLLLQAVTNLVQNALEFTPGGGAIHVGVDADGPMVRVTVEDTGPGVPDYALPRLCEPFYSLPRPDTGRRSTGLGLSIVREIARLHGGVVSLGNRPGGGARAILRLPAA